MSILYGSLLDKRSLHFYMVKRMSEVVINASLVLEPTDVTK